jgi:hypothetical protein
VYANQHKGELFNDGWMIYAIYSFMKREQKINPGNFEMIADQWDIFNKFWMSLRNSPRRGYDIGEEIDILLVDLPNRFAEMTYELAAFKPLEIERNFIQNLIIHLGQEYRYDPQLLLEKFQASQDVRSLMLLLKPV